MYRNKDSNNDIVYLDGYAEPFFEGLIDNIKDNIFGDFDHGNVSPETFRKFFESSPREYRKKWESV